MRTKMAAELSAICEPTPRTPLWSKMCRMEEWNQCLDKIHDIQWMRDTETSNKNLRFVIPIEHDTVERLPKLMRAVYQEFLDAGARNMVHQFFGNAPT